MVYAKIPGKGHLRVKEGSPLLNEPGVEISNFNTWYGDLAPDVRFARLKHLSDLTEDEKKAEVRLWESTPEEQKAEWAKLYEVKKPAKKVAKKKAKK